MEFWVATAPLILDPVDSEFYTFRKKKFSSSYSYSYNYSVKIFPATSQSYSTQTAELIVRCHTSSEMETMIFHDIHSFISVLQFWKGPQKGV